MNTPVCVVVSLSWSINAARSGHEVLGRLFDSSKMADWVDMVSVVRFELSIAKAPEVEACLVSIV